AVQGGDVLQRHEDVPVELDVRNVVDEAVGGQDAVLILPAEERDLDALPLVLLGVVLHGHHATPRPEKHGEPPIWAALVRYIPAATYSPRQLPTKYHRREEA